MGLRVRPLGPVGAALEVALGAYVLLLQWKNNEPYPLPFDVFLTVLGCVLVVSGSWGLARASVDRRNTTPSGRAQTPAISDPEINDPEINSEVDPDA